MIPTIARILMVLMCIAESKESKCPFFEEYLQKRDPSLLEKDRPLVQIIKILNNDNKQRTVHRENRQIDSIVSPSLKQIKKALEDRRLYAIFIKNMPELKNPD
jgi:hypothetical protein